MQIHRLDHVNLRTAQLEVMVRWYTDVLGMRSGARPDFPFPGAWMYLGNQAPVHLIGVGDDAGAGSETELKLEHFAFSGSGREEFVARLEERGIPFRSNDIPSVKLVQINLWDPDGNHIHVDFSTDE